MPWLNLARTGKFRAMSGKIVDLTRDRLARIAAQYQPDKGKAPLVFGHPDTSAPAFGWVHQLRLVGDVLQGKVEEVSDAVKKMVEMGHYKHVSMSITPDDRLVHVGLLGAVPPAIDGLGEVSLASAEAVTIQFSGESADGGDPPDDNEPETEDPRMNLEQALARIGELESALAEQKAAKEAAEQAKATAEQEFAAYKAEQVTAAREARFAALVADGRALPTEKDRVMSFAATLSSAENQISFAGADGKTEQVSQEEAYWRELEARPANGLTHEFATSGNHAAPGRKTADRTGINDYA